ncbi:hypothetical protein NLU66_06980 [Brachybacterium sp. NBEC-018]|uniref:hypothetical protein n=1 Tax=Brachybacterium sp. NBEC-018 TaxID=2996004 RepID=UPI002175226F|nr:hypothetical protein [Brachybacterium sp. NBEC-018]UVY85328.1 hypothetical protein NLU66_06980 [Brachybacterium sp. NBEC-018]
MQVKMHSRPYSTGTVDQRTDDRRIGRYRSAYTHCGAATRWPCGSGQAPPPAQGNIGQAEMSVEDAIALLDAGGALMAIRGDYHRDPPAPERVRNADVVRMRAAFQSLEDDLVGRGARLRRETSCGLPVSRIGSPAPCKTSQGFDLGEDPRDPDHHSQPDT